MKKVKIICALVTLSLACTSIYAQASEEMTWESQKIIRQQEKEAKAKAAREAKLARMSPEQKSAFLAKEAEKEKALAEKKAAKDAAAAEKKAAKDTAAAEKKAAKDAALQEKLSSMTPEQRAKFEEKEALKAKIKADIEADQAMRKATLAETKTKVDFPYFTLDIDEGIELVNVNRVMLKTDRSNYVISDVLAGAYVNVRTNGFKVVNPMLKVSALMGMGETFNNMKVKTSSFIYGVDGFLGLDCRANFWNYAFLNFAPGVHCLFQDADRFTYLDLGLGAYLSVEMPISYNWTIILGGQATYDWGNFGTNALLETYDHVWQTSIDIGVRYSSKHVNKYNYIGDSAELQKIKKARVQALKDKKKAEKAAKAAAKKAQQGQQEKAKPAKAAKPAKEKKAKEAKQ